MNEQKRCFAFYKCTKRLNQQFVDEAASGQAIGYTCTD